MVRLRPLALADCDQVRAWRNRPHVRAMMYTDHEIGVEEHARWFDRAITDPTKLYFVIEDDGHDCGLAGFTEVADGRASWAFYLADAETRGRGLGAQTEYLMLTHAFEQLGLSELRCEVFAFNAGVVAMHESFGFKRTGLIAGRAVKDGEPRDVVTLAMRAEDWPAAKARAQERFTQKGLLTAA
jgi:UDP-4-amino-4,6-dideoxy-N-acetyl-beta-L-altrosamine N-acetyltransferase